MLSRSLHRRPLFVSSAVVSTAALGVLLAGCGNTPRSADDPATNLASARVVVEEFVSLYNERGMPAAARASVCTDRVGEYSVRSALGEGVQPGIPLELGEVTVDGHAGRAQVAYSPTPGDSQAYLLTMRKDDAQGWCIGAVKKG